MFYSIIERNTFLSIVFCSGLLTLASFVFSVTLVFAQLPSCLDKKDVNRTAQDWWDKMGGAVFKVYIVKNGEMVPRGTATLIDKRGYFITASHIFEYSDDEKDSKGLLDKEKIKILLAHFNSTIPRIEGYEVYHRTSQNPADISLIKADKMPVEVADQVATVDLLFDFPRLASKLFLLGYKLDKIDPYFHSFSPSRPISTSQEYIQSRGDEPYYGESGSLGINQAGLGVAILEGFEKKANGRSIDPNLFKLTPLVRGREILSKIDKSDIVLRLLNNLRNGNASYVANTLTNNSNLSTIDLFVFVNELLREIDVHRTLFSSSKPLRESLRYKMMCKELFDSYDVFEDKRANGNVPKQVRYEEGRMALGIYKALAEKAIPKEARRSYLERSLAYFRDAENKHAIGTAQGFTWLINSREEYAQFQAEYAYALNEGYTLYPDMEITRDSVNNRTKLALSWDNKNELAYKLAATGKEDLSYYRHALDHAINEVPKANAKSRNLRRIRETAYNDVEIETYHGNYFIEDKVYVR